MWGEERKCREDEIRGWDLPAREIGRIGVDEALAGIGMFCGAVRNVTTLNAGPSTTMTTVTIHPLLPTLLLTISLILHLQPT